MMLLCPPQHGKSTITSKRYPAYILGKKPSTEIVSASATIPLAEEFGGEVRNCINSNEYKNVFGNVELMQDSQAKGRWKTSAGGGYYAVGIGGSLFGRGGEIGIIDDPFASWEDAQSEVSRNRVWNWYTGTFYNRMRPGAAIVIIQHRMHEDDLVGRLLEAEKRGGDKWEIVNFEANPDNPPWPEVYNKEALERIRDNTDPLQWSALYMQNPLPPDGIIVRPEWLKRGLQAGGYGAVAIGVDPAVGLKDQNDETAICVGGLGYGKNPVIDEIETIYGHFEMDEICNIIQGLQKKYQANLIGIEDVQAQRWLIQELAKRGTYAWPLKTGGRDKVARLMSVSHFMTQGRVNVNTPKLHEQLLRFRGGDEANDLVDAFVWMLCMIRDFTTERAKEVKKDYSKVSSFDYHFEKEIEAFNKNSGVGNGGQINEDAAFSSNRNDYY